MSFRVSFNLGKISDCVEMDECAIVALQVVVDEILSPQLRLPLKSLKVGKVLAWVLSNDWSANCLHSDFGFSYLLRLLRDKKRQF